MRKALLKSYCVGVLILIFGNVRAQDLSFQSPDPAKVQMYLPYLVARHGGTEKFESWKQANILLYYKEIWYFTESFEVVRNYSNNGVSINEEMIDITRFESMRQKDQPQIVVLPGFKDALKLMAGKDLLYKPEY